MEARRSNENGGKDNGGGSDDNDDNFEVDRQQLQRPRWVFLMGFLLGFCNGFSLGLVLIFLVWIDFELGSGWVFRRVWIDFELSLRLIFDGWVDFG